MSENAGSKHTEVHVENPTDLPDGITMQFPPIPASLKAELDRVIVAIAADMNGHKDYLADPLPRMSVTGLIIQRKGAGLRVTFSAEPEVV